MMPLSWTGTVPLWRALLVRESKCSSACGPQCHMSSKAAIWASLFRPDSSLKMTL